jgi:hypothetical protein
VNWITLAQDKDKWWALVSKVMKVVFYKCREFLNGLRNY